MADAVADADAVSDAFAPCCFLLLLLAAVAKAVADAVGALALITSMFAMLGLLKTCWFGRDLTCPSRFLTDQQCIKCLHS